MCARVPPGLQGLVVTAYSPLGSPDRPFVDPAHPALLANPVLAAIAVARGRTPAQIALRWQVQRGIGVIPKSVTPERIKVRHPGRV